MGFEGVKESHIYTSASLVSKYIVEKFPHVKKAFVIGMKTVRKSLEDEGIEVIGANEHILPHDQVISESDFDNMELDPDVGAVVYGLDAQFTH